MVGPFATSRRTRAVRLTSVWLPMTATRRAGRGNRSTVSLSGTAARPRTGTTGTGTLRLGSVCHRDKALSRVTPRTAVDLDKTDVVADSSRERRGDDSVAPQAQRPPTDHDILRADFVGSRRLSPPRRSTPGRALEHERRAERQPRRRREGASSCRSRAAVSRSRLVGLALVRGERCGHRRAVEHMDEFGDRAGRRFDERSRPRSW